MKLLKLLSIILITCFVSSCNEDVNTAVLSTSNLDANWWKSRHENVLAEIKESSPQLIMIGNSITHGLDDENNIEFWDKYLNAYNTVNMGFGGDRTENVIWRLENGEIDGINPKVATLMIGTNNTDGNNFEEVTQPEELAEGIWKICTIINEKLPDTEIALLAIFPYGYKPEVYRNKLIQKTNDIIRTYPEKNSKIHFYDVNHVLEHEDGSLIHELMPDYLHPNTEGYRLIFDELAPEIEKLMK